MTSAAEPRASYLDWPIAPALIGLAFLLSAFLDAAISPFGAIRSILIGLALALAITAVMWAILRDGHAASVVGTAAVIVIISPAVVDHGSGLVRTARELMPLPVQLLVLAVLIATAVLLGRIVWLWFRTGDGVRITGRTVNGFSVVLLIVVLANAVMQGNVPVFARDFDQGRGCVCPPASSEPDADHPDVFLILLDGYARADTLERLFDYDNQPFLDALRDRGFEVAEEARSDYLWTHSTLASMLNMSLVEDIPRLENVLAGREPEYPAVREVINDNAVFATFRANGYDVIATASGYERTALRRADAYLDGGQMNEFEYGLLRSTLVGTVLRGVMPDFAAAQHRDRVRFQFDVVAGIARSQGEEPQFAFIHVPSPHLPAVFDAEGDPRAVPMNDAFYADSAEERGLSVEATATAYRDQLEYINALVTDALDVLVAERPDATVIVMSDHGPAVHVDWNAPDHDVLVDRTRILFAARTAMDDPFAGDESPATVFSRLFAQLFPRP